MKLPKRFKRTTSLMQVIRDSAEHHFLTMVNKVKQASQGWVGIHCAFSRKLRHDDLIADLASLSKHLAAAKDESSAFLSRVSEQAAGFTDATVFQFADNDLMIVTRTADENGQNAFYDMFKTLTAATKPGLIDFISFGRDMIAVQKLAERKLLMQRRMAAYATLCDSAKIASIPLRRENRVGATILLIEDDHFTATYTTNILNKDYELVMAKTGEDAIIDYVERAPDIVFLDIHLPGLNGLETLSAIRRADPKAHVIMLSVDTVQANVVSATRRGAAGFLKKPFSKDRIRTLVEKSPFVTGSKSIIARA